jgi:hypothetical protein
MNFAHAPEKMTQDLLYVKVEAFPVDGLERQA